MPNVLLSTAPQSPAEVLRPALIGAGFTVIDHALGTAPPVDFGPVTVAVIDVGERTDAAAAQTRRWRTELGDTHIPVLWVLPETSAERAALGLDAGAGAVLTRPIDPAVFLAQVRSMIRSSATAARIMVKAAEARLLGDQLQKAYSSLDRELDMSRRVHRTFLPRSFPEVGAARFAVCYRPRSRVGGDFYDVQRLDEAHIGFYLGDVMTHGSAAGSLLSVFVKQSVKMKEIGGNNYRLVPPDEVLVGVNRELIGLGLEEPPLVAMLVGVLNVKTGDVKVARAGGPPPVKVSSGGLSETWNVPGPFLGTADTSYLNVIGQLAAGDKLVFGSDGTRPDGEPSTGVAPDLLAESAAKHRGLSGQAFVDSIARDLLPHVRHPDDFTLLAVEMTAG